MMLSIGEAFNCLGLHLYLASFRPEAIVQKSTQRANASKRDFKLRDFNRVYNEINTQNIASKQDHIITVQSLF